MQGGYIRVTWDICEYRRISGNKGRFLYVKGNIWEHRGQGGLWKYKWHM